MRKITTDLELNTATEPDLVTENYELDVLGLKNAGDFRKFSKSFIKLDKIVKNIDDATKTLDDRISSVNTNKADKTINITAGSGLKGGGNISVNRTISVLASDDSVVVGDTGIKVNTYNGLDSTSTTRPLSANAGKLLNEKSFTAKRVLNSSANLNDITSNGIYQWYVEAGYPNNLPPGHGSRGNLEVIEYGSHILQKLSDSSGNIFYRMKHGIYWNEWRSIISNYDIWRIQPKEIVSANLNEIKSKGYYFSRAAVNVITNKPTEVNGAFELTVTGIDNNLSGNGYTTQLLKDYRNNNYYIRTNYNHTTPDYWTPWEKVVLSTELDSISNKLGDYKYLGSALSIGASVPFGNYNEFIVITKYNPTEYFTSYYFHKSMFPILKHKTIRIPAGEGAFVVDTTKSVFRMTHMGENVADGGIDVYVR